MLRHRAPPATNDTEKGYGNYRGNREQGTNHSHNPRSLHHSSAIVSPSQANSSPWVVGSYTAVTAATSWVLRRQKRMC